MAENSDLVMEIAYFIFVKGSSTATEATKFLFNMRPSVLTEVDRALYTGSVPGLHFVSLRISPM